MLRAVMFAILLTMVPPSARLSYVQAVTIPLFQCDTADAYNQLTLCPQVSTQIADTPIPRQFHGHVRTLAVHLRSESAHCAWIIRSGTERFVRTSNSIYPPALSCEGAVADVVTRFYAARS